VLGFAVFQAGFRGDGAAAEVFSRTALAGGRGALTPAVEGSIHLRLAMARARLDDLSGAAAAIDVAEELLASADPEAEPAWIYWFTAGDLHGEAGESFMFARQPKTAITNLDQAVNSFETKSYGLVLKQPPRSSAVRLTTVGTPRRTPSISSTMISSPAE